MRDVAALYFVLVYEAAARLVGWDPTLPGRTDAESVLPGDQT